MSKVVSNFYTISATTEPEHKIFYRLYVPDDNQIVATLLLVHGMQEHSGRYEELASYLTTQNFAVLSYDQLGHGKTALQVDQLGYFKKHGAKKQLIDDAITMSNFLRETYPQLPQFILGHSMGSFVTRCVLQKIGRQFKGPLSWGQANVKKDPWPFAFYSLFSIVLPLKEEVN
ncbi:Predicted hydrolase of the alpha/beta-hydrolase fold [Sphingobacterium multivorum]|uniref:Predicted hydrolase of the alpha/beta-hydrolase fold n=1 Tax=Sphingobacterium multivorum TaxID=28454 RepID=A0A2X2JF33_SPHMU|nr:alpha/beta fold hydrolase [Sphingobacterium multivorum]SPZ92902.1 Predicted hydrolase of the alpha/beta-hydrolase fold [Sphingobacterium multivorum]